MIRKESRKHYDEYAKYDEASSKLQKQMEQSQAELAATQFVGKSAQDLVVATLTGDKKVVSIDFNAAVVDPEDTETLSDMTVQAINAAIEEIDAANQENSVLSQENYHFKLRKFSLIQKEAQF